MSFDMMHSDQWLTCSVCDCFCFCHTDKKRTNKPRTVSYTDCINIIQCNLCIFQSLFYYLINLFNMLSRCDFRNHTTI